MEERKNPVQSAERIFAVLELLADQGAMGLMELSSRLNIHKSTVHRLLQSLICMGYVIQEAQSGKYILTFKLVQLAEKMKEHMEAASVIHPYMLALANESGETVHFVQRRGNEVVYVDKVEPTNPKESSIRMASQIGMTRPMYCSGVGKAILAQMTEEEVRQIWYKSKIEKKTEYTLTTLEELIKELKEIRICGYALDNEENEIGVRCIAVCVGERRSTGEYAISISAPVSRMPDDRVRELSRLILKARDEIHHVLT